MVQESSLARLVGEQVRLRREQRSLTSAELARRAGLAKATLSGLEAGRGNPTIETLDAVAQALGVPLADVLAAPATAPTRHVRPAEPSGDPVQQQLLHRITVGRQVETWALTMLPGAAFDGVPHSTGTREQLVVCTGGLTAGPTDDQRTLLPGDSLVFDGTSPHRYVAGPDGAGVVVILTSPTND